MNLIAVVCTDRHQVVLEHLHLYYLIFSGVGGPSRLAWVYRLCI